jgi:hypothetical protein
MQIACKFCSSRGKLQFCTRCEITYCFRHKCQRLHEKKHAKTPDSTKPKIRIPFRALVHTGLAQTKLDLLMEGEVVVLCSRENFGDGCVVSVETGSIPSAAAAQWSRCTLWLTVPVRKISGDDLDPRVAHLLHPELGKNVTRFMREGITVTTITKEEEREVPCVLRDGVVTITTYEEVLRTYQDAALLITDPGVLGDMGFRLEQIPEIESLGDAMGFRNIVQLMEFCAVALHAHEDLKTEAEKDAWCRKTFESARADLRRAIELTETLQAEEDAKKFQDGAPKQAEEDAKRLAEIAKRLAEVEQTLAKGPDPNDDVPFDQIERVAFEPNARVCAVCGAPSRFKCGGCRIVKYCGRECQAAARAEHAPFCM